MAKKDDKQEVEVETDTGKVSGVRISIPNSRALKRAFGLDEQPNAEVAGVATKGEPAPEDEERGGPYIAGEPQEYDELPRQQRSHGVVTTQAAVDPSLAKDINTHKRLKDRPDTIPQVQARVLAVMDLSQAFGLSCEDFKAAVLCAVNEEHTETDANCWCGSRHPKKRKTEEDAA